MTVHRAQGATIERVVFLLAHVFAYGQVYTALSRAEDFDSLRCYGMLELNSSIRLQHKKVLAFERRQDGCTWTTLLWSNACCQLELIIILMHFRRFQV
jgi:hypothetical protein